MGINSGLGINGIRPGICTSSTRPSNPYKGMMIYETDTGNTLVYQSATTGWTPPWNQAWGVLNSMTYAVSTNSGINGTLADVGPQVTFIGVTNRLYLVSGHCSRVTLAQLSIMQVRNAANAVQANVAVNSIAGDTTMSFMYQAPYVGAQTMKLCCASTGTTPTIFQTGTYESRMIVQDIGPNGAPL